MDFCPKCKSWMRGNTCDNCGYIKKDSSDYSDQGGSVPSKHFDAQVLVPEWLKTNPISVPILDDFTANKSHSIPKDPKILGLAPQIIEHAGTFVSSEHQRRITRIAIESFKNVMTEDLEKDLRAAIFKTSSSFSPSLSVTSQTSTHWTLANAYGTISVMLMSWPEDCLLVKQSAEQNIVVLTGFTSDAANQWISNYLFPKNTSLIIAIGRSIWTHKLASESGTIQQARLTENDLCHAIYGPSPKTSQTSLEGRFSVLRDTLAKELVARLNSVGYALQASGDQSSALSSFIDAKQVRLASEIIYVTLRDRIVSYLADFEFDAIAHSRYIIAKHRRHMKSIFIRIDAKDASLSETGLAMDFVRFKVVIKRLLSYWSRRVRADGSGLQTDILTSLDWHAYYPFDRRKKALVAAIAVYGVSHVQKVLRWMCNTWPYHPTNDQYVDAVEQDLEWLESTYVIERGEYFRRAQAVANELQNECRKMIARHSAVRRFVRDTEEISRFYIVQADSG